MQINAKCCNAMQCNDNRKPKTLNAKLNPQGINPKP